MNGTGAVNQASDTASALAALGFHTIGLDDAGPVGDVVETVAYNGRRSPATEAAAESVVRSMTGAVIVAYDPSQVVDGAQVTAVTGTQFAVNSPPRPSSGVSETTMPAAAPTTSAAAAIATPSPATS